MTVHWVKDTNPGKPPSTVLKSHSPRPEEATKANIHNGVNTQDIIPRCGWDLDSM